MLKRDKSTQLRPVEIIIIGFVCLFLLAVMWPSSKKSRFDAYRTACSKNLSEIGRAMLVYANDYDGWLPRSGGRNSVWASRIRDWKADNRLSAFGLSEDGSGGVGNISSCFYLLVKYADVEPKTFVCPGEERMTEFKIADVNAGDKELFDLWDFGPTPSAHCSYSYHMPFDLYALTLSNESGMAVAADRNPWISSPEGKAKEYSLFDPEGSREAVKVGNTYAHDDEGQNVLFLDGHVSFEENAFCGVKNDNIYTFWDGGDIRMGGTPFLGSMPQDRIDSLLVNEPGVYKSTTTKQPKHVNSADLKQTSVIATLDCPMPENNNIIWCGTFQIAWDKFKNEIIGEPIRLIDVEDLDDRLNSNEFSPENLEAESFYAAAGFVKDGIIERIKKEMARRFPSEPAPVINRIPLPEASVAYAFLSVDAGFKYPFYTNNRKFTFQDSKGTRTDITSFSDRTEGRDSSYENIREQVEILYYKYGPQNIDDEFAVDLCKYTEPYQVVLARMPRGETLRETLDKAQKYISAFKQDPDYEVLRKLRSIDSLIVPDVLYKLTHHFKDLERKNLANPKWQEKEYLIFEARQMVHFSLSRTGVIIKSEALIGAGGAAPPPRRIEEPRHFYFNKPFLIYVKKRGSDYTPFFMMWVDNAELMEKF